MGTHGGPGITAQGQEEPERETQGDAEETPAGTPEADLFPACVRFDIVAFCFFVKMDCHSLDYLLGPAYRDMRIHAF